MKGQSGKEKLKEEIAFPGGYDTINKENGTEDDNMRRILALLLAAVLALLCVSGALASDVYPGDGGEEEPPAEREEDTPAEEPPAGEEDEPAEEPEPYPFADV